MMMAVVVMMIRMMMVVVDEHVEMEMVERVSWSSIMRVVELNIHTLAGEESGTRPGRHQQLLDPPPNCRRRPGQV